MTRLREGTTTGHALRGAGVAAAALALTVSASCQLYFGDGEDDPFGTPDVTEVPPVIGDPFPGDPESCDSGGVVLDGPFMDGLPLDLGPTVQAEEPPPPISGGTLAISPDDKVAVAADPDRDQIYIISLETNSLVRILPLTPGDEPGRVAFAGPDVAYVALRRGGAVVAVDIATQSIARRTPVCAAPRGMDVDTATGALYVACHGGELMALDLATGAVTLDRRLENGLRDVVVDGDLRYVSVFRPAEVIVLNRQGQEVDRLTPPALDTLVFDPFTGVERATQFEPAVAWRTVKRPDGGIVMVHQRARTGPVAVMPGGYGSDPCSGGVVHGAVTPLQTGQVAPATSALASGVLPVDVALINGGQRSVVVLPGSSINAGFFPSVFIVPTEEEDVPGDCMPGEFLDVWQGEPIAVDATRNDLIVVQMREPAELHLFSPVSSVAVAHISLSSESRADTGHALFHMTTFGGVSCAGCHAEGGDDGRVWDFQCIGPRRTQSLSFGLLGTEPFHWDGDMTTFDMLMNEVFVGRMGGGEPRPDQVEAMAQWMDTLRPPPRSAPDNPAAVARGKLLFEDPVVGCASCHAGAKFTNNQSHDVGTGGAFQVPSLIGIADRAPFIHTGCADTLRERFTNPACGGGDRHGVVSTLSVAQIDDLVAYLETL